METQETFSEIFYVMNDAVNDAIEKTDEVSAEMKIARIWVNAVASRQERAFVGCEICGLAENAKFEGHHVGGRKQDESLIVKVCLACHSSLSKCQMLWDARFAKTDNPEPVRRGFVLRGFYDILTLKAEKTKTPFYADIAARLPYKVWFLLGGQVQNASDRTRR